MSKLVALGSDPELFLEDENGKVISAIGKIGGTKDKPRPLKELGKGYFVQEDNVLLEYNTPAAKNIDRWQDHHWQIRHYLEKMVDKLGLNLSKKASHSMDPDQMNHPNAFVFGCDPDFDVWTVQWNKKPKADDPLLRSAGGHVHVAYSDPTPAQSIKLGRILDYYLGAPLAKADPDKKRRELYGKAGAIRFKPYGLEYRTPSNFWTLDPLVARKVWTACNWAVASLTHFEDFNDELLHGARDFINGDAKTFDDNDHPVKFT